MRRVCVIPRLAGSPLWWCVRRIRMSESLLLTFQTQLSGVMETILRSAVCEITRLVEGSFLEEISRGKQEAETLRRRLQILETKLNERERIKRVRCSDCSRTGVSKKDTAGRDPRRQTEGKRS